MAHYQRAHLPGNEEEALQWAERDTSAAFKIAALLNKLKFGAGETGILHAGCTYGILPISVSLMLQSLSPNPANVVGIDTCRPLLDLARAALDVEAITNRRIHDLVSFCELDVARLGEQANSDMIRVMFPRGISTIIATEMFKGLENEDVWLAVRHLMALLRPGGRLVFDTYHEPLGWGAVHVIERSVMPHRLVAIINLVTPMAREIAENEAQATCIRYAATSSTAPGGVVVPRYDISCVWLGRVWEDFARLPRNIGAPVHAPVLSGTAGADDGGILANGEDAFNSTQHSLHSAPEFSVTYSDRAGRFFRVMIDKLVTYYQEEQRVERLDAQNEIEERVTGRHGMRRMDSLFRRYRRDLFEQPNHIDGIGLWRVAAEIFANEEDARHITGLPTMPSNHIHPSPASILVTLRRA